MAVICQLGPQGVRRQIRSIGATNTMPVQLGCGLGYCHVGLDKTRPSIVNFHRWSVATKAQSEQERRSSIGLPPADLYLAGLLEAGGTFNVDKKANTYKGSTSCRIIINIPGTCQQEIESLGQFLEERFGSARYSMTQHGTHQFTIAKQQQVRHKVVPFLREIVGLLAQRYVPFLCFACALWALEHKLHRRSEEGAKLISYLSLGNKLHRLKYPEEYVHWVEHVYSKQQEVELQSQQRSSDETRDGLLGKWLQEADDLKVASRKVQGSSDVGASRRGLLRAWEQTFDSLSLWQQSAYFHGLLDISGGASLVRSRRKAGPTRSYFMLKTQVSVRLGRRVVLSKLAAALKLDDEQIQVVKMGSERFARLTLLDASSSRKFLSFVSDRSAGCCWLSRRKVHDAQTIVALIENGANATVEGQRSMLEFYAESALVKGSTPKLTTVQSYLRDLDAHT